MRKTCENQFFMALRQLKNDFSRKFRREKTFSWQPDRAEKNC